MHTHPSLSLNTQALFEGHNLRLGYINFLVRVTRGRIAQVNYDAVDEFGTEGSRRYRELGLYPRPKDDSEITAQ